MVSSEIFTVYRLLSYRKSYECIIYIKKAKMWLELHENFRRLWERHKAESVGAQQRPKQSEQQYCYRLGPLPCDGR